jgi:hypothetical protein
MSDDAIRQGTCSRDRLRARPACGTQLLFYRTADSADSDGNPYTQEELLCYQPDTVILDNGGAACTRSALLSAYPWRLQRKCFTAAAGCFALWSPAACSARHSISLFGF